MSFLRLPDETADVARLAARCHGRAAIIGARPGSGSASGSRNTASGDACGDERRQDLPWSPLHQVPRTANAAGLPAGLIIVDPRGDLDCGDRLCTRGQKPYAPEPRVWMQGGLLRDA